MASKVLIVEDDPIIAKTMTIVLESSGYQVRSCKSYEDSVPAFAAFEPDIVLTDLTLPGASGLEVIAHVTSASVRIPVVAISGSESKLKEAVASGATESLEKPFSSEDLVAVIERHIGKVS